MKITRESALELLKANVKNEKMIIHSLSSEAVMRALARRLGRDEEKWGIAGLLHDLDVEYTNAEPTVHGLKAAELLGDYSLDEDVMDAIMMHNEVASRKERTEEFQHALAAGETITGLIYATTLVYPDKKIASINYKSVSKRMKQPAFAASVKRENIMECEKIGLSLDEFIQISVDAMREIHEDIGL